MSEEIKDVLDTMTDEVRAFQSEELEPLKKRLASLEERETPINDEKVVDLEKRLAEAEGRYEERLSQLQEEMRLADLAPVAAEKSADTFSGAFFQGLDDVRRGLESGETRAITSATSISGAGKMNAEQATAFLDYVVGDQATLSRIERRVMNGPTADIDRIAVGTRKLVAASEGADPGATDGVTFAKRSLSTEEVIWAEDISLSFLEDNIAKGNAEGQIAAIVGKAIGEELNELAWVGDEDSGTAWIALNDGFEDLFVADSGGNVSGVDLTSDTTAVAALASLYKTMPSQYRTMAGQSMFVSATMATKLMDEVADRKTGLGDTTLTGGLAGLSYYGVPLIVDRHIAASGSAYMTPTSNLVFGVQRDVTSETEWNPRKRQVELTVSVRFDFQYKFGGIVARGHSLTF